jgi:murein L,D-transpeptidase YcbB/YkuD
VIFTDGWRQDNVRLRSFSGCLFLLTLLPLLTAPAVLAQDATAEAIYARVDELQAGLPVTIGAASLAAGTLLSEIYARRDFRPLWPDESRIRELLGVVAAAQLHGLDPKDYHATELRSALLRNSLQPSSFGLADADLLATDALVRFLYHLRFGKVNPASVDTNINFRRELDDDVDPADAVVALVSGPRELAAEINESFPFGPVYRSIQAELARYGTLAAAGGWLPVPEGPTLRPGDTGPRVAALRERLRVTGELAGDLLAGVEDYDDELEEAVGLFQRRHALDPDGVAGAQTLAAANVPVTVRIDQLRLTLERLRWVQGEEPSLSSVVVNIAGFDVFLFRDGEIAWSARAQVGTPYRQTPLFRDDIRYLEINPTWTVPPTILRNDILPKVRKDPGYLAGRDIELIDRSGQIVDPYSVDWSQYTRSAPFTFRQRPGTEQRAGPHQVHVSERALRFPARHAQPRTVRPCAACLQLRLHPRRAAVRVGRAVTRGCR